MRELFLNVPVRIFCLKARVIWLRSEASILRFPLWKLQKYCMLDTVVHNPTGTSLRILKTSFLQSLQLSTEQEVSEQNHHHVVVATHHPTPWTTCKTMLSTQKWCWELAEVQKKVCKTSRSCESNDCYLFRGCVCFSNYYHTERAIQPTRLLRS